LGRRRALSFRSVHRGLLAAGALPLIYLVLIAAVNAGCPAIFARLETWLFLILAGACSVVILYVAAHQGPRSTLLVQAASGVIVGMFLQPSTSGIVALVTAVLSLAALPRRRSFFSGLALFAFGIAVGIAALILTSTTPTRC
jgi:hypothetical protein